MTGREWQPGDVGITGGDYGTGGEPTMFLVAGKRGSLRFKYADGDSTSIPPRRDARPLVVIDPEDHEQVERLTGSLVYAGAGKNDTNHWPEVQTALRSLVAPPKPDEPTGLGAVVEDAEGARWVRGHGHLWSRDAHLSEPRQYPDVTAVRVLSEGVTP